MNTRTTTALASGACLAALFAAGCSSNNNTTVESTPATTMPGGTATMSAPAAGAGGETFAPPGTAGSMAFTYDESAVPAGSTVDVETTDDNGRTTVTLSVAGLAPNRDFGAHVHARPCGPAPADSGPHYQNDADPAATPEKPSTDPAYANPQNEVWLDFTTDANGDAHSASTVDWTFRPDAAHSVVIHAHHTMTGPGQAGTAGDRLACVDEMF